MGHLQDMSDKQRNDFICTQYKARNEARRGYNFTYLNDDQRKELEDKGYTEYMFDGGSYECGSSEYCKPIVVQLRKNGHYARIVVNPCYNIPGTQTYAIWHKRNDK